MFVTAVLSTEEFAKAEIVLKPILYVCDTELYTLGLVDLGISEKLSIKLMQLLTGMTMIEDDPAEREITNISYSWKVRRLPSIQLAC